MATTLELLKATQILAKENMYLSISDLQKSPWKQLEKFRVITNNWNIQGVYIPYEEIEDYIEDLEALASPSYLKMIQEARESDHLDGDEVIKKLNAFHNIKA
jgi:hypothetical protein